MKASEIEELVQQITDRICQQLPKPTLALAFRKRKKRFLPNYIPSFPLFSGEPVKIRVGWNDCETTNDFSNVQYCFTARKRSIDPKNTFILLQGKPILVLETLPAIPKETPLKYQVKKTIQEYRDKCQQFGLTFYRSPQDYADFWKSCQKNQCLRHCLSGPSSPKNN